MKVPQITEDAYTEDQNLEGKTDDAVQELYDTAVEAVENHLNVTVERDDHFVTFTRGDASLQLTYEPEAPATYWSKSNKEDLSKEEFCERYDEETLKQLKKAMEVYAGIVDIQMKTVSTEVIEARYY